MILRPQVQRFEIGTTRELQLLSITSYRDLPSSKVINVPFRRAMQVATDMKFSQKNSCVMGDRKGIERLGPLISFHVS